MLDSTERKIDARLSNTGFLRDFMSEVVLCIASHDQQTPVLKPFGKSHSPVLASEPESFCIQTDRCSDWPHLGFSIGMRRCRSHCDKDYIARRCTRSWPDPDSSRLLREWLS